MEKLQMIHQGQMDWRGSSDSCERTSVKLATIINTELLFNLHPCQCGFYWTGRVIQAIFESIRPNHDLGYCGTLHNNVLSFENCYRKLRPLCYRDTGLIIGSVIGGIVFLLLMALLVILLRKRLQHGLMSIVFQIGTPKDRGGWGGKQLASQKRTTGIYYVGI
ncbi:hypothetical protein CHS0354_016496 [Potamilus streckersoni]|uniref:Uncharacterized protein n=1 Tax=Potamilus streckersoni TaxID=2493646 RepID=A0AAE0VXI8_9BIVA|nr:hypothetical protein CHS0354_016496 [Potamilus streckersoni]